MNCKKGDLAIVIKARNPKLKYMIGAVVQCVEYFKDHKDFGSVWLLDVKSKEGLNLYCQDDFLRPLRDSGGEDEMLRIAGKPWELSE